MDFVAIFKNIVYGMFIGGVQYLPIAYEEKRDLFNFFSAVYEGEAFLLIKVIAIIGSSLAIIVLFKDKVKAKVNGSKKNNIKLWKNIIIGCIPSILINIFLIDKGYSIYIIEKLSSIGIIIGGITFLIAEYIYKKNKLRSSKIIRIEKITIKNILIVGIIQGVLLLLGVSPILGGMVGCWLIGVGTHYGIEYSLLSSFYIYMINIGTKLFSLNDIVLTAETIIICILVLLVSFFAALLSMDMLIALGKKKSLRIFAFINILIGVMYLI